MTRSSVVRPLAFSAFLVIATLARGQEPSTTELESDAMLPSTPLGTSFTYQGALHDGASFANGNYDLQLKLFDAATAGAQVGATLTRANVAVSDGLFSVALDFGASPFAGNARWLEVGVRPGGTAGAFTVLTPRQAVTAAPEALHASASGGAAGGALSGSYPNPGIAAGAVATAAIADGAVTDAKVASGIAYGKLSGTPASLPPSGPAGGSLSGTYPNPAIAANAVGTLEINAAGITSGRVMSSDGSSALWAYPRLHLPYSDSGDDASSSMLQIVNIGGPALDGESVNDTGVYGESYGPGNTGGVVGVGRGLNSTAVVGFALSQATQAGWFQGNVNVVGAFTATTKSFKIDDPLDPEHRYLYHTSVESPDMKTIYDGVVTLGASGGAVVELPGYFEALNSDFRYQLTAIGAPGPGLYIAREIAGNRFTIAGGTPGTKVSWQVTGIRHDPYAEAHRTPVEEDKPAIEQGSYLHPDVYGQPDEKGIDWARNPVMMQRMRAESKKAAITHPAAAALPGGAPR